MSKIFSTVLRSVLPLGVAAVLSTSCATVANKPQEIEDSRASGNPSSTIRIPVGGGILSPLKPVELHVLGYDRAVMNNPLLGREFAGPETYLGPLPTATILLRTAGGDRNESFCTGYLTLETTGSVITGSVTAPSVVTMRWMLKSEPTAAPTSCQDLVSQYDFVRAKSILDGLAAQDGAPNLSGPGPFIVQWMPDGSAVVFDGSTRSAAAVRQMASQWIAQTGSTIAGEGSGDAGGCLTSAVLSEGDYSEKFVALMKCEFPEGITLVAIKKVTCGVTGLAAQASGRGLLRTAISGGRGLLGC